MAKLSIKRNSEWNNRARDFKIYLDGENVDVIGNNETKELTLNSGKHILVLKIDWCSSKTIQFEIKEDEIKEVKVSGFKYGQISMPIGFILLILYYITSYLCEANLTFLLILPLLFFAYSLFFITLGKNRYIRLIFKNQ